MSLEKSKMRDSSEGWTPMVAGISSIFFVINIPGSTPKLSEGIGCTDERLRKAVRKACSLYSECFEEMHL